MYFENLEVVKQHANEIICFYSDNDPYVKYEAEKDFADKVSTNQIMIQKTTIRAKLTHLWTSNI